MQNTNRGRRFHPEPLTPEEVERLLDACPRTSIGARNAALVSLMAHGGLRLNEALELRPCDIDLSRWTVRVTRGAKFGKARTAPLFREAAVHLERWLHRRERFGLNGRHRFICTVQDGESKVKGSKLDQGYSRRMLATLARKAAIEKRVHPHGLRHSWACARRATGADLVALQHGLGHANLATTAVYLRGIGSEAAIEGLAGVPMGGAA